MNGLVHRELTPTMFVWSQDLNPGRLIPEFMSLPQR